MPDLLPPDVPATVVLAASSVFLGLLLPLGGALAILGVVRGFADAGWRTLIAGLLLVAGAGAAAAFLRAWGVTLADDPGAVDPGAAERTAAVVLTAVAPVGVILAAVFLAAALIRLVVDRRRG